MRRCSFVILMLVACVSLSAYGVPSITVDEGNSWYGKVREYANPFDPGRQYDNAVIDITVTPGWTDDTLRRIVNRVDGSNAPNGGGRLTKTGDSRGELVWMTFTAPGSSSFTAGTVIVSQTVGSGFSHTMDYTFKLGNGTVKADGTLSGGSWREIGELSQSGNGSTNTFYIANPGGTYNTFRLDITAGYNGGITYADFSEVLILPDKLDYVKPSATSNYGGWGSAEGLLNLNNSSSSGWAYTGGARIDNEDVKVTFTFGDVPQKLDAIVFWSFDHYADATFTLQYEDASGTMVDLATISMPYNDPKGWVLPVELTESLYTTKVVMNFGNSGANVNFREVMFFEKAIPEPATMSLLALGGLALLRRRT